MRTSRSPSNERILNSSEWLNKSQIKGFFSRLAATRRKEQGLVGLSLEQEEDVECLVQDFERQELIEQITAEIGLNIQLLSTHMTFVNSITRKSFQTSMFKC